MKFDDLAAKEKDALLRFPVYIVLLAANNDGNLDNDEKKAAIKFSHIKTFTADPILIDFYKEADKVFEQTIQQLDDELSKVKAVREAALIIELTKLEKILQKLDKNYVKIMHHSMNSFKDHVSKAHHNILIDFMFPFSIKGLTE